MTPGWFLLGAATFMLVAGVLVIAFDVWMLAS